MATNWKKRMGTWARAALAGALAFFSIEASSAVAAPALWVVRDADSTIYLFGTMHALKSDIEWRSAQINRAFADSNELILEAVTADDPAVALALARTYGFDPAGSLSAKLEVKDREQLAKAVQALGAPPQALEKMRPWMAAVTLAAAPMIKQGWLPASGVEAVLTADAKAAGKQISGLETADQQMRMLADLPEATQVAALRSVLGNSQDSVGKLEALAAAWAAGDLPQLETRGADLRTGRDIMIDDAVRVQRNRVWADDIQRKLAGSGTSFIAVGAGHLLGRDSVQEVLASRGVKVTRLN